jgi:hypothetical protein
MPVFDEPLFPGFPIAASACALHYASRREQWIYPE